MPVLEIPVWRHAPFIRLFLPFASGILIQYYAAPGDMLLCAVWVFTLLLITVFHFSAVAFHFRFAYVIGILFHVLLMATGSLLLSFQDLKHEANWFGHHLQSGQLLIVKIEQPLSEKNKSFKTVATVSWSIKGAESIHTSGQLLIYFKKESTATDLKPGYEIIFRKSPGTIRGSNNPGAFDYANYMSLQGIYHQVYLTSSDFKVLRKGNVGYISRFLIETTRRVLKILRRNIRGEKECGLAEALLIGYKDDLDKALLQSYANTGVVHVIAISGLHLGLIYWLLAAILKPVGKGKKSRLIKSVIIITGLWMFSLLAGASPSVLRSALMFSFIVIGEASGRKVSIYNSLAASAFLLICYNPFWLWDVGFILSYIAVLSLVIFMKPFYHLLYIKNKLLDTLWNITAVTLAAQVLTFPVCIFLFHQFPVYFLFTNLVAIPLSSVILLGEILICAVSFFPVVASCSGYVLSVLITLMNRCITYTEQLPFSSITEIRVSFTEMLLMYIAIGLFSLFVFNRWKQAFFLGLTSLAFLAIAVSTNRYTASGQKKLVVYNIKNTAVEMISGHRSTLLVPANFFQDSTVNQYLLLPSLIHQQITQRTYMLKSAGQLNLQTGDKDITMITGGSDPLIPVRQMDVLIVTGNAEPDLRFIKSMNTGGVIVFDGSNSLKNINKWTAYCATVHIDCWNVMEKGAFILSLN